MFNKILIANRGEIACRVIKTARKLGIKTVAIYSEADTNSAHVTMADEAIFIGPSSSSESYLNIERLMGAIRATGTDAVHPGYGFLSENAKFAKELEKANVAFIGPSVKAIELMGDKITSKKIAQKANVNTIPGYTGVIKNSKEAVVIAEEIGFPVMVKAAAGGGGKGMRVVYEKKDVEQAYKSATNEAANSFGDNRIFIEKFIEQPRHIEIQVLADKHGNVVCLGERECSIQRHHQKVIEEAPSPFLDEKTRKKMYSQCVDLAKEVDYFSAGTVEFIVDKNKNFYFLEMNTRLQVEHPVTEYITGLDLVEQMINVAAGKKLSFKQEDVNLKGWAIESRIYAEDPIRGFLPSSGRISEYKEPETSKNVRVDSGVYEGGQVSMFYDAMIAKLITYGKDRNEAIARMQASLGKYVIRGVSHNISFLEALISHKRFAKGDLNTNFIAEEYPDGFFGADLTSESTKAFLATAIFIYLVDCRRAASITGQIPGRPRQIGNRWVVQIDDDKYPIYVKTIDTHSTEKKFEIVYDNETLVVSSQWTLGNRLFHGTLNGKAIFVQIENLAGGYNLNHAGSKVCAKIRNPRTAELESYMPSADSLIDLSVLEAPISGMVVDMLVKKGDSVKKGQDLLILEAMKMENIISAERDAVIKAVHFKAKDSVAYGQVMIEFE